MIQVDDIGKYPIEFLRTRDGRKIYSLEKTAISSLFFSYFIKIASSNYIYHYSRRGNFLSPEKLDLLDILFDNVGYEMHKMIKGEP